MSIFSRLRRTVVDEGSVYRVQELFGNLTEEFSSRDRIFSDDEVPHEYRLYDPHKPVEPRRDIKNLCEKWLVSLSNEDISEPEQLDKEERVGSTYCTLYNTYQHIEDTTKKDDFINNLSRVFWFIRPNIYDNRMKFHGLMDIIIDGNSDHIIESIKTLADRIVETYISDDNSYEANDIKTALDGLRGKKNLDLIGIKNALNTTKHRAYSLYEKSFENDSFKSYKKIFRLKYKESLEEKGFKHLLEIAHDKIYKQDVNIESVIDETSEKLYNAISSIYKEGGAMKADLVTTKQILDIDGREVVKPDGFIEVKMRGYAVDSYLSEFFSIYKDSNIHPKFLVPNMINIYNATITSLYNKVRNNDSGILNDINNNFEGMFFGEEMFNGKMMPIFIPKKDIKLYWSDQGMIQSNKQKRLTIRYRVSSNIIDAYFYDRETSVMTPTKLKGSKEEYIDFNESISDIGNLLLEGRKEDTIKKYGEKTKALVELLSQQDPSGNNKYLDWMTKMATGGGTDETIPLVSDITRQIEDFHRNLPRITNKDINSYKSFTEFTNVVDEAVEKEKHKIEDKKLKNDRTIIYESNDWLVVSPNSHKASCYYGAGTKWCVTMKDHQQYWAQYTARATFYFIINKHLTQDNPLYKVAYRLIGGRAKYELWNAVDTEFSKTSTGTKYLESLPEDLIEKAMKNHRIHFPESDGDMGHISGNDKMEALFNEFDTTEIEESHEYWHGLETFDVDGDLYAVGDSDEMDTAVWEYLDNYDDGELLEYYDPDGHYLSMDESSYIDEEVDYKLEDMSEEEIVDEEGDIDEYNELVEKIEDGDDEDGSLQDKIDEMVWSSRNNHRDNLVSEWERCFRDGIVDCLVDQHGLYSNASELYEAHFVDLDREGLISSTVEWAEWSDYLSTDGSLYESQSDDGTNYFIVSSE